METKKIVSVDIISSCICRDCFEIGKRILKNHQYNIEFFYQATSPFSLYSKQDERLGGIKEEDLIFGSPWQRRLIISEFRKNLFEKIGDAKKEAYLILDFTDFARNLYKLSFSDSYLLQTDVLQKNEAVIKDYIEKTIYTWDLPSDVINKCLDNYVSDIMQRYDSKNIILCEAYYATEFLSRNGEINKFSASCDKINEFIEYCYNYFKKAFEQNNQSIHVIPMPKHILSSELHKWGNSTRHFCDEYYEYLFSAIDCCVSEYDKQVEDEMILCLKEACESAFLRHREIGKLKKENERLLSERDTISVELKNNKAQLAIKNNNVLILSKEIENIKSSKSYKIGRFVTFLPRKLLKKR